MNPIWVSFVKDFENEVGMSVSVILLSIGLLFICGGAIVRRIRYLVLLVGIVAVDLDFGVGSWGFEVDCCIGCVEGTGSDSEVVEDSSGSFVFLVK